MLTMDKFKEEVIKTFKTIFGSEYTVEEKTVQKNNGVVMNGLVIRDMAINVAPVIYIEELYYAYKNGESIEFLVNSVMKKIRKENAVLALSYSEFMDYEKVKDKITIQLINYEKNTEVLKNLPYKKFLDMAVVFRLFLGENDGNIISSQVTETLLSAWGVSIEEIYDQAVKNSARLLPIYVESLEKILFDCDEENGFGTGLYLVSNKFGINGAGAILYTDEMRKLSERFDTDMIILPSSVHEVLLRRYDKSMDMEELKEMVRSINATEVPEKDVLSDNIYIYRKDKAVIEMVSNAYIAAA